ncbi:hypothetical protein BC832DRAFT_478763 [Gaertneriomyces semiglobifer]|nr:hypothetical protein BC832DRAFT_478763 [Gaertneriomyces semiglobifer]
MPMEPPFRCRFLIDEPLLDPSIGHSVQRNFHQVSSASVIGPVTSWSKGFAVVSRIDQHSDHNPQTTLMVDFPSTLWSNASNLLKNGFTMSSKRWEGLSRGLAVQSMDHIACVTLPYYNTYLLGRDLQYSGNAHTSSPWDHLLFICIRGEG